MAKDYYQALGVGKSASSDDIKKAYKTLAKQYHPDLHKGDKAKEEKFKEINEAYSVLGDEKAKARYDQFGTADTTGFQGGSGGFDFRDFDSVFDFDDLFNGFFGSGGKRRQARRTRGADLRHDMEVTLEEAATGTEKEITIRKYDKCETCNGTGAEKKGDFETCDKCRGQGRIVRVSRTPFGMFQSTSVCDKCRGEGRILAHPCKTCHGQGKVEKTRRIEVKIPAGVFTGATLRISGEGEYAPDDSGDLYIFIHVKDHAVFTREDDDLQVEIPISITQAALGADIEVPTIEGKATLEIPAGTETHTVFRMRGKGISHLNHHGTGDEMVKVVVVTPKNLTKKQRELLEEFEKENKGFFKKIF